MGLTEEDPDSNCSRSSSPELHPREEPNTKASLWNFLNEIREFRKDNKAQLSNIKQELQRASDRLDEAEERIDEAENVLLATSKLVKRLPQARPRSIVVKFGSWRTKEEAIKRARQKKKVFYDNVRFYVDHDFPLEVLKKRIEYAEAKKSVERKTPCKDAYFLRRRHPAVPACQHGGWRGERQTGPETGTLWLRAAVYNRMTDALNLKTDLRSLEENPHKTMSDNRWIILSYSQISLTWIYGVKFVFHPALTAHKEGGKKEGKK